MINPKVSIIIPFVFLSRYVLNCIEHCLSLDYTNYTLVLLPDEKIDLPLQLIQDSKLKVIETGSANIAKKRNKGINSAADAQYCAFIDSDGYPHRQWLKNAIGLFGKSEDIGAIGGPSICPPQEEFKRRVVNNASKSILVSGIRAKNFREEIIQDRICMYLSTCNLIVKQETIKQMGGFNESYITGEDREFCKRIRKKNMKIVFSKDVIVYHHSRRFLLPFIRQKVTYGYSVLKTVKEDCNFFNLLAIFPALFILFIFLLFVLSFLIHIVLHLFLFVITLFIFVTSIETFRWSYRFKEIPFTFIAIMMGSLTPALGIFMSLLRIKVNIQDIYKNRSEL